MLFSELYICQYFKYIYVIPLRIVTSAWRRSFHALMIHRAMSPGARCLPLQTGLWGQARKAMIQQWPALQDTKKNKLVYPAGAGLLGPTPAVISTAGISRKGPDRLNLRWPLFIRLSIWGLLRESEWSAEKVMGYVLCSPTGRLLCSGEERCRYLDGLLWEE